MPERGHPTTKMGELAVFILAPSVENNLPKIEANVARCKLATVRNRRLAIAQSASYPSLIERCGRDSKQALSQLGNPRPAADSSLLLILNHPILAAVDSKAVSSLERATLTKGCITPSVIGRRLRVICSRKRNQLSPDKEGACALTNSHANASVAALCCLQPVWVASHRGSAPSAQAQTKIALYSFIGGADGDSPSGLVRDENGNLYGTTFGGGTDPPPNARAVVARWLR